MEELKALRGFTVSRMFETDAALKHVCFHTHQGARLRTQISACGAKEAQTAAPFPLGISAGAAFSLTTSGGGHSFSSYVLLLLLLSDQLRDILVRLGFASGSVPGGRGQL